MNQKLTEIAVSTEWKWACEHWYVFFILGLIVFLLSILWSVEKKRTIRNKRWLADEWPEVDNDVEHK